MDYLFINIAFQMQEELAVQQSVEDELLYGTDEDLEVLVDLEF